MILDHGMSPKININILFILKGNKIRYKDIVVIIIVDH